LSDEIFLFSLKFSATLINLDRNGQIFYENQAHKRKLAQNGQMLYGICWAIRLIAAQLLTLMSHKRPVPSPQGGFGGLSPSKLKYENYKLVEFCQFVQCQGIGRETKNAL